MLTTSVANSTIASILGESLVRWHEPGLPGRRSRGCHGSGWQVVVVARRRCRGKILGRRGWRVDLASCGRWRIWRRWAGCHGNRWVVGGKMHRVQRCRRKSHISGVERHLWRCDVVWARGARLHPGVVEVSSHLRRGCGHHVRGCHVSVCRDGRRHGRHETLWVAVRGVVHASTPARALVLEPDLE